MEIMRDLTKEEEIIFKRILLLKPMDHLGYISYRLDINGIRRRFKRSRLIVQLHLGKYLESWELVCHKDGNKKNDDIENLEVLNHSEHNALHHNPNNQSKPNGWKPANTTPQEIIERIKEIASGMVKINCSEIARILKKEKININSVTVKRYL